MTRDDQFERILEAMKVAAAALRDAGIPFALAGGLAVYARGGPPTEHDVDFLIQQEDADRALDAPGRCGLPRRASARGLALQSRSTRTTSMIDLIFAPNGRPERVPDDPRTCDRARGLRDHLAGDDCDRRARVRSSAPSRSTRRTTTTCSRSRAPAASRSNGTSLRSARRRLAVREGVLHARGRARADLARRSRPRASPRSRGARRGGEALPSRAGGRARG